jgi:hypothetical protein
MRSGMPAERHFLMRSQSALDRKSGSPRRATKNSSIVW